MHLDRRKFSLKQNEKFNTSGHHLPSHHLPRHHLPRHHLARHHLPRHHLPRHHSASIPFIGITSLGITPRHHFPKHLPLVITLLSNTSLVIMPRHHFLRHNLPKYHPPTRYLPQLGVRTGNGVQCNETRDSYWVVRDHSPSLNSVFLR